MNQQSTRSWSRPVRLVAFWLLLLVPAIPVETAFGALACAHMPDSGAPAAMADSHAPHGETGGHDPGAHLDCTWLGPCAAAAAMLSSPATAPTFAEAVSQRAIQWVQADADLPHPLAYLRPHPIPPPLPI